MTLCLCFVGYMNYLLVGDFFFCFFLAALTSVSLQKAKKDLIWSIETSYGKWFPQTRNSHIFFVGYEIYRFVQEPNKSIQYVKERATSKSDKFIQKRKELKQNIFNDA